MKNFKFSINGKKFETTVNELEENRFEIEVNGKKYSVDVEKEAAPAFTAAPAAAVKAGAPVAAGKSATTKSPLPGTVVNILVSEGQKVKAGETILTMESMKMENEIKAECAGTIGKIYVTKGQSVMQDDKLFDLTADAVAAAPKAAAPVAAPAPKPAAAPAPAAAPKAAAPAGGKVVKSPLPGTIVNVLVNAGQTVKRGDTLLTMESMKMENEIKSEFDGTVSSVAVSKGQNVMQDDVLIVMA